MIGLALEGGGAKGAYQIGAYKALFENNIKFDGITGTSIGSINAALLINNDIENAEKFWTEENLSYLFGLDLEKKDSIVETLFERANNIKSLVDNDGVDIAHLRNKLEKCIDEKIVRKSQKDYGLVTVRINDKRPLELFIEDIPEGKLIDYLIASSYLPIFKPTTLDGENYFLDGGLYDASPSNMLEEKGYTKIYIIALNAIGYSRKKIGSAEIIRISPSRNLGSIIDTDPERIKKNIDMGYYDTIKFLKKLDGKKYIFEKKSDWLYNIYLSKVTEKTLKRAEVFFFTKRPKELILKSIEYILDREKSTYARIYDPFKEIKRIKKKEESSIAYKLIKELRLF